MAVRFYPLVRFQSASDSFRFAVPTRSASVVFADNLCVHTVRTNGWERMAVRFYPLVRFQSADDSSGCQRTWTDTQAKRPICVYVNLGYTFAWTHAPPFRMTLCPACERLSH